MKNTEIVLRERVQMMRNNALRTTGNKMMIEENNEQVEIDEPEELLSYWEWKNRGYQVPRGTKAKAYIQLWSRNKETGNWYMKSTPHFTFDQVVPVEEAENEFQTIAQFETGLPFGDFENIPQPAMA